MGTTVLTVQNNWCHGLNSCQLQLFLEEVRLEYDDDDDHFVNKTNLVHNLFSVYLSISTCFGRLRAHHQELRLCLCDTWYLLFCVDDCLVCKVHPGSLHKDVLGKYFQHTHNKLAAI